MKEDTIIFGLIALFIVYTLTKRKEGFFDMSGYNNHIQGLDEKTFDVPMTNYKKITGVTNDDIDVVVTASHAYLKEKTGHCVHIIETNKIEKFTGPRDSVLYKSRFMCLVKDVGFPYAFGVDIDVLDGKVIKAYTQSYDTSNQGIAEEKQGNFEDIEKYYDSKIKDVF